MKAYREGKARGLDGVPLHYTVYGDGDTALVCCNGVGVSTFFWKYVVRFFSERHKVVTWDYRNHGKSGRAPEITREKFTVASSVSDLKAVMDDAGIKKAILLGHSMGVQVILEMWRRYPARVQALTLVCGAFGRPLDTFWNSRLSAPLFDLVYAVVNSAPNVFRKGNKVVMESSLPMLVARMGVVDRKMCREEDLQPYFDHLAVVDPQVFFLMAGEMQRHTAIKWLDKIDVPTLVVAGEHDLFTPHHLSVQMRDRIPGAELLTIPRGSHAALIEQPELMNLRLEKFLRERVLTPAQAAQEARVEAKGGAAKAKAKKKAKAETKGAKKSRGAGKAVKAERSRTGEDVANDLLESAAVAVERKTSRRKPRPDLRLVK
ncbi:MAG TPA: alpha/beta hydrolase [bacterium]|nr:alpha/beta hydrolase [bacterium]